MNMSYKCNRLHKTHSLLVSMYWHLKGCGLNALWPIRRPGGIGAWQKSLSLDSPLLASLQSKKIGTEMLQESLKSVGNTADEG